MDIVAYSRIDDDLLNQIGRLRVDAWKTEAPEAADMETWVDVFDENAMHWVVFEGTCPVAAARMSIHRGLGDVPDAESYLGIFPQPPPAPIASLNRLVVHPAARGHGLSKQFDLLRLAAAEHLGCRSAILSTASGPHRVRQLCGWGFEVIGVGPKFKKPPLCHLPPPTVLLCHLPRCSSEAKRGARFSLRSS